MKDCWKIAAIGALLMLLGIDVGMRATDILNRPQDRPEHQNQERSAASQAQTTDNRIAAPSRLAPTGGAIAAQGTNQPERQQNWATKLFDDLKITDVALAIFTGLLVCIGWRQWRVYAGQHDAMRRQLRAYLSVYIDKLSELTDQRPIESTVHIMNMGQTPAYDVKLTAELQQFPVPPPKNVIMDVPSGDGGTKGTWAAIAKESPVWQRVHTQIGIDTVRSVSAGKEPFHLIGRVTYKDIFDDRHEYYFCVRFLPDGTITEQGCERYNKPG